MSVLGLFTLNPNVFGQLQKVSDNHNSCLKNVDQAVAVSMQSDMQSFKNSFTVTMFTFWGFICIFLSLYKTQNKVAASCLLGLKCGLLFIYMPMLCYAGDYVNGPLLGIILGCNLFYRLYQSLLLRTPYIILYNTPTIMRVHTAWLPYKSLTDYTPLVCLYGGPGFVSYGNVRVDVINAPNDIVVIGAKNFTLILANCLTLESGERIYVYTPGGVVVSNIVVGKDNPAFIDIDLNQNEN